MIKGTIPIARPATETGSISLAHEVFPTVVYLRKHELVKPRLEISDEKLNHAGQAEDGLTR